MHINLGGGPHILWYRAHHNCLLSEVGDKTALGLDVGWTSWFDRTETGVGQSLTECFGAKQKRYWLLSVLSMTGIRKHLFPHEIVSVFT